MRVLKAKKELFILIIDIAIFTGVIIGVLVAKNLNNTPEQKVQAVAINNIESLSTFAIGDYSDEEDKDLANINLKQDLKKKYDIDVFSGESAKLSAASVDASCLYDPDSIYEGLTNLANCFSKYPNEIFFEVQNKGYDVSVYLVDKFNNNNLALATRDSNNNFNIYISNSKLLEKSIHHEFYHILEYYMKLQFDINNLYKDWSKYNPIGFEYNPDTTKLDGKYVYNPSTNTERAYFVTIYAKSLDKEDRAETFADMMLKDEKPVYYNTGEMIGKKAEYIASVLYKSFNSVKQCKDQLYWKRFI